MRTIRFMLMLLILGIAVNANAEKKGEKTVVFQANLHCVSCKNKVEKNIPFEKGVKDLKVDMDKQTITVTFREDKNSVENLQKAIEKLHIEVKGVDGKACDTKAGACCGQKNGPKEEVPQKK